MLLGWTDELLSKMCDWSGGYPLVVMTIRAPAVLTNHLFVLTKHFPVEGTGNFTTWFANHVATSTSNQETKVAGLMMAVDDTMIFRARVESVVVAYCHQCRYCHYCGYVTAHKRRGNRCEVDSVIRVGKVPVSSKVLRLNYLISKLSFQLPSEETKLKENPHTKTTSQRKYLNF